MALPFSVRISYSFLIMLHWNWYLGTVAWAAFASLGCSEASDQLGPGEGRDLGVYPDLSPEDMTPTDSMPCHEQEFVDDGLCVACPPGTFNDAGDDPAGPDTVCDPNLCDEDERVQTNGCVGCAPGESNEAGDDASGDDTSCDVVFCEENERVAMNTCVVCEPGQSNEAGDDASGGDSSCDSVLCEVDERVLMNACVACDENTSNDAGDDASGPDTLCESVLCDVDERVEANRCVACEPGLRNESGDDSSGPDTVCFDACLRAVNVPCASFNEAYIKAVNPEAFDEFGFKLDMAQQTLVVAARQEDGPGTGVNPQDLGNGADESGAAYVYELLGGGWIETAYLKAFNTESDDLFGQSVAVDGSLIAVGAPLEDSDAVGINGDQTNNAALTSGAVYVYERGPMGWGTNAYLKASNSERGDTFGWSVALSGNTLVVGAPEEDGGVDGDESSNDVEGSGAVFVFVNEGGAWRQQAYLKASNSEVGDEFGWAVAVSGDTLVVGAIFEDGGASNVDGDESLNDVDAAGAAYVFERTGDTWSQTAYLKANGPSADDFFGWSVDVHNDTIVVGVPLDDEGATNMGSAHVFSKRSGAWLAEGRLRSASGRGSDLAGTSVAIFGDRLVMGASSEDGSSRGLGGDPSNVGLGSSGAVYLFERVAGTWTEVAYIKASNTDRLDGFGRAVAMTGTHLVVGADNEYGASAGVNGDQSNNDAQFSGAAYIMRVSP
ncbi:MAG: hypothetical protein AAGD10_08310 [Myxococcota bacterium]